MFKKITKIFTLTTVTAMFATTLAIEEKKKYTNTYIWGNGQYQARPDAIMQFLNFQPKKISNFYKQKSLKSLQFGQSFEAGIDINNMLLIWPSKKIEANIKPNNKDSIRQNITELASDISAVKFTKGFIWALNTKGEVFQWKIIKKRNQRNPVGDLQIGKKNHVKPFKQIKSISTGADFILALDTNGEVFVMGDDTVGQCCTQDNKRPTNPPFNEVRVTYPQKINNIPKMKHIVAGAQHSLAIDQNGTVYGWGSNSNLQLSHQQQFSKKDNPLLCSHFPLKLLKNIENVDVSLLAAGDQFTIISGFNRLNNSYQVYSTGCNLKGQLGIGLIQHLKDISKMSHLSNFSFDSKQQTNKLVKIDQIQCGKNHCIALLNIGYIMQWGDNQYGQMGNKKRSRIYKPAIIKQFENKKVLGVFASQNSTGVIVQEQ